MSNDITAHAKHILSLNPVLFQVHRVLNLIITQGGVLRTDEKSWHSSCELLIQYGYVLRNGNTLSIGDNFEELLLTLASLDSDYGNLVLLYRNLVASLSASYDVADSRVVTNISSFMSTDQKILYLSSIVADLVGKVDTLINKVNSLEAFCNELELSVSFLESVNKNENPNS